MVQTPIWSEYKITFSKSNTLLDYLFSKGYYPYEMNNKHFMFNPFENYKSSDLETSHIGILNNKQIIYIPEDRFNKINQVLSDVTTDMFEYAFSLQNKELIILKRGVCMYVKTNGFTLCGIDFDKIHGDQMMCRLDLFKILDDERIGWVPVSHVTDLSAHEEVVPPSHEEVVPSMIDLTEETVDKEDVLNAALNRITVKSVVNKFKQTYHQVREDVKNREIRNGWLN